MKQIYRHLCILKISRRLGLQDKLSQDVKLSLVDELIKRSEDALKYGKDLLNTDLQYGDEYLVMAVHLLLDIWQESGDYDHSNGAPRSNSFLWPTKFPILTFKYFPKKFQISNSELNWCIYLYYRVWYPSIAFFLLFKIFLNLKGVTFQSHGLSTLYRWLYCFANRPSCIQTSGTKFVSLHCVCFVSSNTLI